MRRRTEGFTLVELMVVVLVIGILVAVAVPVFSAAQERAAKAACASNQRMIVTAVEAYRANNPDVGDPTTGNYDFPGGSVWYDRLVPSYLSSTPKCPARPNDSYAVSYRYIVGFDGSVTGCLWRAWYGSPYNYWGNGYRHYQLGYATSL